MDRGLWISKTGLEAQDLNASVAANNLANISTTGFKKGRAVFEDLLYQNLRQPGGLSSSNTELPSGLMLGTGVRPVATQKLFTQGNIAATENPLDLAVNGRGFLQVTMPDNTTAYTRDGRMQVDNTGRLVNSSGYPISPAITIPANANNVTIGTDGVVSITTTANATATQIGQIQIADFVNVGGLEPLGENLFRETTASGTASTGTPNQNGLGSILQSSLETSNVSAVEELIGLIQTQRAYEMNAKSIEAHDNMLQFVTQVL